MGSLKVIRGRQRTPVRGVFYGVEGIGKTTLAAQFPNALILDTENGSTHIDCARVNCPDWQTLEGACHDLVRDAQGFQTVVIDSADWMERSMADQLLKSAGKKSIEDFGFGKGYVMLQERVAKFLALCDTLVARGLNVLFIAHAKVQRTSPPDQTDGYDRYELKLSKQVAPLLREWADVLLFLNYRMKLVEGGDGRMKAIGGKERVMYAERNAAWDAKNRFNLPEEMPMGIEPLRVMFDGTAAPAPRAGTGLAAKATAAVEAASTTAELDALEEKTKSHHDAGRLTTDERNDLLELIADRRLSMSLGAEPASLAETANANK